MKQLLLFCTFVIYLLNANAQTDNVTRKKQSSQTNKTSVSAKNPKQSNGSARSNKNSGNAPSTKTEYYDGTLVVKGVVYKMIKVQAGTFTMGASPETKESYDNEKPSHQVTLTNDYYIGRTEVTQALWKAVMGNNPSYFKGNNLPVENISWDDCQLFLSRLNSMTGHNFRLPTEAEWEFAARGGNKSNYYMYSGSNDLGTVAWCRETSIWTTHNVATKKPNELGIYDMSGNVAEWCADLYGVYSNEAQENPTGPNNGYYRVARGGCWDYDAGFCRSLARLSGETSNSSNRFGLRLAIFE